MSVVIKLAWLVVLGVAAYAVHPWLDDPGASPPRDDTALPSHPLPQAIPVPSPVRLDTANLFSVSDLSNRYARDPLGTNARLTGRCMDMQGTVESTERGQDHLTLITFQTDASGVPLRAVLHGGQRLPDGGILAGEVVRVSCVNRGLLMSQPVLGDCRLVP